MNKQKLLPIIVLVAIAIANPLSTQAAQDCDDNAVIWCGATYPSDVVKAATQGDGHNSSADISSIYAASGIDPNLISSTVEGTVTKAGNVLLLNNRVVATNAQSVGRQFMEGSTAMANVWIRPTSVSFVSDSLPAYVYMQNNQFMWAVIKSCGNPVTARPVVATTAMTSPTPTPVPAPTPVPKPTPAPMTKATPAPAPISVPPPTPATTPIPKPATTPKTGSEAPLIASVAIPAMFLGLKSYRKSRQALIESASRFK